LEKTEEGIFINGYINGKYQILVEKPFLYLVVENRKYMILYHKSLICILIDCETNDTYFGLNRNSKYVHIGKRVYDNYIRLILEYMMNPDLQKTSGIYSEYIADREIKYNGLDRYYYQLTKPWIPSGDGYGIGAWRAMRMARPTKKIVFFNGFINPQEPDLFFHNSRVKNITVTSGNNSWNFALKDDPNPQILELPKNISGDIRLTINSVYKGSKNTRPSVAGIYFLIGD
jgi:hypothetical protein